MVHLSMADFSLLSQKLFCSWVWVLKRGIKSGASPALADREERGILEHLTAKWDCDTEKLRTTVLRYGIIRASVHKDMNACAGELCVFQQYLIVAVMVLSAVWFFCKARCTVVMPNLQSDLHQNSRR